MKSAHLTHPKMAFELMMRTFKKIGVMLANCKNAGFV